MLKAYKLVPKAYWQKFRKTTKEENQTYVEFARMKEGLFDRWCTSQNVNGEYAKLRQLLLLEEFKNYLPSEVKTYLDEHKVESLQQAATPADGYTLTHKRIFPTKVIDQQGEGKTKIGMVMPPAPVAITISEALDMVTPHWTNPGKEIDYHLCPFLITVNAKDT